MRSVVLMAVVTVLTQQGMCAGQEVDPTLYDRLKEDAHGGWKRCESAFDSLESVVRFTQRNHGQERVSSKQFNLCSMLSRSQLLVIYYESGGQRETHRDVINPRYSFSVHKQLPSASWSLASGRPNGADLSIGNVIRTIRCDALSMLNVASVYSMPLTDIVGDTEHFRVLECREIDHGKAGRIVRCQFQCRHHHPRFANEILVVDLLPDQCWALKGFTLTNEVEGIANVLTNEFQDSPNGVPCLSKTTLVRGTSDVGDTTVIEYEKPTTCNKPSDEFYLPFYGISESAIFPSASPRDWMRYLLIFGGISLVLIGVFLWKRQSS